MIGLDTTPGNVQQLGEETPGCACTLIRLIDGTLLRVYWDGRHEVAGMYSGAGPITIYCPPSAGRKHGGKKIYIPWHRIDRIEHFERDEEDA